MMNTQWLSIYFFGKLQEYLFQGNYRQIMCGIFQWQSIINWKFTVNWQFQIFRQQIFISNLKISKFFIVKKYYQQHNFNVAVSIMLFDFQTIKVPLNCKTIKVQFLFNYIQYHTRSILNKNKNILINKIIITIKYFICASNIYIN